mmetsp:Transcript_15005/g.29484  ORF Transcript_15005/g.29484 Transcript_15005/m.29484 type:complete len:87 (+) Transcript_15005:1518-1778(+)
MSVSPFGGFHSFSLISSFSRFSSRRRRASCFDSNRLFPRGKSPRIKDSSKVFGDIWRVAGSFSEFSRLANVGAVFDLWVFIGMLNC